MQEVPFFGELYRRTTVPLLSPVVTCAEASFIAQALGMDAGARVLDVGCGHGRHLAALRPLGARLFGVDFDTQALACASAFASVSVGDLRALPFRSGAFSLAYCWYTTLFVFDEEGNRQALAEVARVLRPGGRFLLHGPNPARLARRPSASFEHRLPDGSVVREMSRYDAEQGADEGVRTLHLPDGEIFRGRYRIRAYRLDELTGLFTGAGLRILNVYGSVEGEALRDESLDLIALGIRGG